ncbi:uncharacterized protein [Anabrus simplex]|uniref:uncharacterized protein n=1 Tax=Anabrus simplex TaxID=316456 RepID=UPI0035A36780
MTFISDVSGGSLTGSEPDKADVDICYKNGYELQATSADFECGASLLTALFVLSEERQRHHHTSVKVKEWFRELDLELVGVSLRLGEASQLDRLMGRVQERETLGRGYNWKGGPLPSPGLAPGQDDVTVSSVVPIIARQARQSPSQTDLTVRNILEWLQGRSNKDKELRDFARRARDNGIPTNPPRIYLPAEIPLEIPYQTQAPPRPFEPNPTPTEPPRETDDGYPYQQPPSPAFPRPPPPPPFPKPAPKPAVPKPPPPPAVPKPKPARPSNPPSTYLPPPTTQLPPVDDYEQTTEDSGLVPSITPAPDDHEHTAPHIHNIEVECAKDMMNIRIQFDRVFNGIIYSKGFYKQDTCRYVQENSGSQEYSFTVRLDSCGTQFVDQLQEGGQAYLENVLVMQNEAGIQEVWDTVRNVRCLWEGNINKALSVDLSVDMLEQEIVTFSGDTAVATLDIQMGRGPFAPKATGLVKIGEDMTLVVSVEGDPGFDIAVHECIARDSTDTNTIQLTDERGCILRPKLMGAFQKTRDTGNTGASIIAYAFFKAFKFPDVMDLTMECNVELCKTECQSCPDDEQNLDPLVRRRRDLYSDNSTLGDPVKVHRSFWVVSAEDVQDPKSATVINLGSSNEGICMSIPGFVLTSMLLLSVLIASSVLCAYLWLKKEPKHLIARTVHLDSFPASKA